MISILRQLTRFRNEDLAILVVGREKQPQIILFGGFAQKLIAAAAVESHIYLRIFDDAVKITRNITFELLF